MGELLSRLSRWHCPGIAHDRLPTEAHVQVTHARQKAIETLFEKFERTAEPALAFELAPSAGKAR